MRREERERRLYERLLNEDISSDRSEVLSLIACDDNRNVLRRMLQGMSVMRG